MKTLTENVELIQMLNRLGHGVCFSQHEKNDTTLCLPKMAANLNQKVVLPGTIQPNVFPNLAWDNVDRSGETTYRVNGMALTQGIRTITPQNTASSYQQTKAEDRRAGSSASSRIHPRRQGRTTAPQNSYD